MHLTKSDRTEYTISRTKNDPIQAAKARRLCVFAVLFSFLFLWTGCGCKHEYIAELRKAPTCLEEGEATYTCRKCGEIATEILPAEGHVFGSWETVKTPSWASGGERKRTCGLCNAFETKTYPRLSSEDAIFEPEALTANGSFTVCLDPGHGGKDGGAFYNNVKESDINLSIAHYVRSFLEERGVSVVMTRETDVMVGESQSKGLFTRAYIANDADADCFVAIHVNAFTKDTSVSGVTSYYNSRKNDGGKDLSQLIQEETVAASSATDRRIKDDSTLVVLQVTEQPACLIEVGFMTCPEEFDKLNSDKYRKVLAFGIANGIIRFLNGDAISDGNE